MNRNKCPSHSCQRFINEFIIKCFYVKTSARRKNIIDKKTNEVEERRITSTLQEWIKRHLNKTADVPQFYYINIRCKNKTQIKNQ